jgi:glycosyltransferase involved in cell wall biosynthesis
MQKKTAIVSPSGNFYGSEQVLFDFLSQTSTAYQVWLPQNSILQQKVSAIPNLIHDIRLFDTQKLYLLYLRLGFGLLVGRLEALYINEGGAVRYIRLLAKCLPHRRFYLHLRMLVDAQVARLGSVLPTNIQLISVSDFLTKAIPTTLQAQTTTIYDPYCFDFKPNIGLKEGTILKIGIVGRVAFSKGLGLIQTMLLALDRTNPRWQQEIAFHFFGDLIADEKVAQTVAQLSEQYSGVHFHGYADRSTIYSTIDAVLHLNTEEALGRIYFEALNYGLPVLGFAEGGIGEIARHLQLEQFTVSKQDDNWIDALLFKIQDLRNTYTASAATFALTQTKAAALYNITTYTKSIDVLLGKP